MGEAVELATRACMQQPELELASTLLKGRAARQQLRRANGQADRFAHVQPPLPLCSLVHVWLPCDSQ
jgi:hypothetical protein